MKGEVIGESSGSNCSNNALPSANLARNGSLVSSGRFKGVVQQQNGHWGAQIYVKHQRIWLGTFKSETEAAMAYDSAAIKIRSGDSHRNIPWSNTTSVREPEFQAQYSSEAVLNMIKDGSYQSKFADFLRESTKEKVDANGGDGRLSCRQLFQKELTPSDVGKLNRLVIPKKYAVKYFPPISGGNNEDGGSGDVELIFYDRFMRLWEFRYCYWSSSQSYVFTRGWNRFVKEKELKAGESITFVLCERRGGEEKHKFCMIDVERGQINARGRSSQNVELQPALEVDVDVQLALRPSEDIDLKAMNLELQLALRPSEDQVEAPKAKGDDEAEAEAEAEGFTLFGVHVKKECLNSLHN